MEERANKIMDILEKEYMLTSNGSFHNTISFLRGNCYWFNVYLALKNKYPELCNITNYFMDDYSIKLLLKNEMDIVDLDTNHLDESIMGNDGLFVNKKEYVKQGKIALKILEEHILKDSYVIVETICELLPFSIEYGFEFDINNFESNHLLLFIYFDDNFFYFVDDPIMLNHRAIKHKNGIFKIKKEEILDAIGQYFNCYIVEIQDVKSTLLKERNLLVLKESVQNYYLPVKILDGNISAYHGYEAIKKLVQLSKEGYIKSSDHENVSKHTEIFLNNAFHVIRGNRYIFLQYLISDFNNKAISNKGKLLDLLQQEVNNWSRIWNVAEKIMIKDPENEAFYLDVRFTKYFSNILRLEEQIIKELEAILKWLEN